MRCRSSTGLVPENSSSVLTPSATMTLPWIYWGASAGAPLMRSGSVCILPKFKSGNGAVMDLVRAVGEAHRPHRGIIPGETRIVGDAGGAVRLDGVVDDPKRHVGRRHLDHGD